jgi:DNA-binding response OmpR family regulator
MVDAVGLKALVVEDEGPVALLIEDMLLDLGCEIAASAADLDKACQLARTASVDFAVLDLNLNGSSAAPVAQILRERQIPFLFSTGYGAGGLPAGYESYLVLSKPFVFDELREKVLRTVRLKTAHTL